MKSVFIISFWLFCERYAACIKQLNLLSAPHPSKHIKGIKNITLFSELHLKEIEKKVLKCTIIYLAKLVIKGRVREKKECE